MLRLIFSILGLLTIQPAQSTPIVVVYPVANSVPLTIQIDSIQGIDCTHASGHLAVSAHGGTPGYTFAWSHGASGTVQSGLASGMYSVTVTDALGNEAEISAMIDNDSSLPSAEAGPPYVVSCSNATLMLNGSGSTGPGFSYHWTAENGGSILSGANTLQPTINKAGKFVLVVTNTQNGCTATDFTNVTAQHVAPAATAVGDTITCSQASVQLTGAYAPGNTTFLWQGPNGFVSTLLYPTVSVVGNYFFTVTDTVTDCITKAKAVVLLDTLTPAVSVSVVGALSCQQSSVQLVATAASSGLKFQWAGPNNFTSNLQNPMVSTPGTYVLVVTLSRNGCTASRSINVAGSLSLPTATVTVNGVLTCNNGIASLIGNSNTPGVSYSWTGPGGFTAGTQTTSTTIPGIYTLTVKSNSNGCSATATGTVTQNLTPPTVTTTGGTKTCANPTVTLTATANVTGASYSWSGPLNYYSIQQNPSVSQVGTYSVTVTNPQNGCSAVASANVGQNTTAPTISATSGTVTCLVPQVKILTTSNTQGITYAWSGPNGFTSNLASPMVSAEGYYYVTVTSPQNGCTNVAGAYTYRDNTPPTAYAGTDRSLNCYFTSVVLNPIGSSMGSQYAYSWTTQEGNILMGANTLQPRIDGVGTYQLKVTNTQNGCTAVDEMELIQQPPVTANISQSQPVSCNGSTNGSATVVAGGGTTFFTYLWPNGATTATATGLSAGTYKVTVADGEGCKATATATITEPAVLAATLTATAQTLPGVNNGSATATASGGTAPYNIKWNTNQVLFTILNLAPGNYTATVTDSKGCSVVRSVTVNLSSCALTGSIAITNITCAGLSNGTATANITGGPNPITYKWSNNATTQTITNLATGNFTVTATDGQGCPLTLTTTISAPQPLAVSIANQVNVACPNGTNGTLSLNNSGGTTPYTYAWSNGTTAASASGLTSGNYGVTVQDAKGCTKTTTATILITDQQPPLLHLKNATVVLGATSQAVVTPQMFDNGSVDQECSIASWTVTPTTFDCNKVGNNTVTITATDSNGNSSSGTAIVTVQDNVAPVLHCPANITVGACHPVVQYAVPQVIDNCPSNLENMALTQGLATGSVFPVGITQQQFKYVDASGNQASCTFTVTVVAGLQVEVNTEASSCSGGCTGGASLQITGSPNYSVQWSTGQNGQQIGNLCPGTYTVTVQDAYSCSQTRNLEITGGDSESPVLLVHNATLPLGVDGLITLDSNMFDAGSTDNCGIASWTFDPPAFDCASVGTQSVHITIKDLNGNAADQTVQVTVQDPIVPTLQCPASKTVAFCHSITTYDLPVVDDNCAVNMASVQLIAGLASGSLFPANSVTTQTFVYTDPAGNTGQCSFNISVSAALTGEITATAVTCAGACNGQLNLQSPGGNLTPFIAWSNGQTGATLTSLCPGAYSVTMTDDYGCTLVRSATISQPAALGISVDALQSPSGSSNNGAIQVTIIGGTAPYTFAWQRNGVAYSNVEDLTNLPAGQYNLLVTDAHGCTSASAALTLSGGSVSTAEPDWAQNLRLQPNPARDQVTLRWAQPSEEVFEVKIYDIAGRMVQQLEVEKNATATTLDVGALSPGLWLVQFRAADGAAVVRQLIIER